MERIYLRRSVTIYKDAAGAGAFLAARILRPVIILRAMRIHKYLYLAALALLAAVVASISLPGQTPASVADRVAAQNTIFEDQYQSDLRYSPERATAFGDYRYNDKLAERSLAALADRIDQTNRDFLAKISAIPTTGMSEQDQLSHDLLIRLLELRNTNYDLKEFEMPVDQMNGVHTDLADLPLAVPLDSVKHYEDYLARLHQIPRVLDQTTAVLRAGMKDKLMPVRFLLEKVPVQCQGIIDADPFLLPTKKYPADISAEDQKRLTQEITDAINTDVVPAYRKFADFVRTDYAPQGRTTLAVTSLPDGVKRYPERHLRPDHHASDRGRNSPDRPARNRSHSGRDDGHRQKTGFRRSGCVPRVAEK